MKRFVASVALLVLLFSASVASAAVDSLTRITRPWKGDLPELLESRRPLRVLVSYNRTNFFLVHGAMRGMEHDLMQAYRKYLSKGHKSDHVRMVFIAVPFEDLIPALLEGRGDIAAAGLTVTAGRKGRVAFSKPYLTDVSEVIVGSKLAPPIRHRKELAGKKIHVMAGSSYVSHLRKTNTVLHREGYEPMRIREADPLLVTEDLLEMANRGHIEYTVADAHIVRIWKKAMPNLQCFDDAAINTGGRLAWAVRPDSKELLKSLNAFSETVRGGTLLGNMVFKRYYVNTDWVGNPFAFSGKEEVVLLKEAFQKYAKKYDFDWVKLAAMAFQESRLDMDVKSNKGAVGVMQIKPSTALDKNVDVKDYLTLDGNVHAGTKYLRFLMDRYFTDVDPDARVDFALAAYNAGPGRVIQLRKEARKMGLDPNKWFGHVEWAAYKVVGNETPTYVANVQMYYAAYKSIFNSVSPREYR